MPGYSRRRKEFPDPHAYLEAVMEKRVRDSVLNFQMSQGYEPKEILPDYLPSDKERGGNAVLMFWANPLAPQHATVRENGIRTRLPASRSEDRSVGNECVSTCRHRRSTATKNKKQIK